MRTFTVGKLVCGMLLILLALPRLDWNTYMEFFFSATWLFFASMYVLANWQAWHQAGMVAKWQKEYHWRKQWIERKRQRNSLERSL